MREGLRYVNKSISSDQSSSKQLGLVSRMSNPFTTKNVFEDVYVTTLPTSLLNLGQIAHHPIFRLTSKLGIREILKFEG
jgi:hypothetical protein